jgi:hypothetical protein
VGIGFSLPKGTAKHRLKGIAMNKLTRILTMGGFGLLAALATSAGPANASVAKPAPEHKAAAVSHAAWRTAGDDIVGYYRTLQGCELAGQYGERAGDWDDHDCTPVRLGLRRGAWALRVDSDNDWDSLGWGVPFGAVSDFPVAFRPVWGGHFRGRLLHRGHDFDRFRDFRHDHGDHGDHGDHHGGGDNHGGGDHHGGGDNHGGGDHHHG